MMTQSQSYDASIAATYDADRRNEEHWGKENDFIKQYFSGKDTRTLLDIPIGTGRFLEFYPPKTEVLGVDISPHMIDQAKKRVPAKESWRLRCAVGDAKSLEFISDESIDVIVCCRLFHLIESRERGEILKEFARVLSGELVLQTYLCLPKRNMLIRVVSRAMQVAQRLYKPKTKSCHLDKPWSHIKSYSLSEPELTDMCTAAGLRVVHKTHLCFYCDEEVSMFLLRKLK